MDAGDVLKIPTMNRQLLVKDMRVSIEGSPLAFKPKPGGQCSGQVRLPREMAAFLYRYGNIMRELSLDEIVKATSPKHMEANISSRASAK